MRIVQLIDSLEAGGAERMAVNYANGLADKIDFSGLVVTRREGSLVEQLNKNVFYLYLNKKSLIDLKALFRLRNFVKKNKVTLVHAHSTSFFVAFLLKLTYPSLKLIRHDHYGESEFLLMRPYFVLKLTASFFRGVIAVNQKLKVWSEQVVKSKKVVYLPNFPSVENEVSEQTILKGTDGKRILCLANLREQKNHFLLLNIAKKLKKSYPEWTFHLVGKDFEDEYSRKIKNLILAYNLQQNVFLYGSKQDVGNILTQSELAVLTSKSEGLPVALLEYGWKKKPVVVTAVGEMPKLIINCENGFVIDVEEEILFYNALLMLIENKKVRNDLGEALYDTVSRKYSSKVVLNQYLNWLTTL